MDSLYWQWYKRRECLKLELTPKKYYEVIKTSEKKIDYDVLTG